MTLNELSVLIDVEVDVIREGLSDSENPVSLGLSLNKRFATCRSYQQDWIQSDFFPHHAVKAIAQYYAPISCKAEASYTFLECMGVYQ